MKYLHPSIPFDLSLSIQAIRAIFGIKHEDKFEFTFIIQHELRSSNLNGMDIAKLNHLFNPGFARACFYSASTLILV